MEVRGATEGEIGRLAAIWHQGWHEAHARIVPLELTRIRTLDSFRERLSTALSTVRVVGAPGEPWGFHIDTPDGVLPLEVWRYEKHLADL